MPRIAREHQDGAILHIVTRGVNRQNIFASDLDRNAFMKWMREAFLRHDVHVLAYCLMPNHIHILVAVGAVPIGRAMHDLLTRYSLLFNARYDRVGHLFQNRFKDRAVGDLRYLINVAAYIHLNPVRASLVKRPDGWTWSGHVELLHGSGPNINFSRLVALTGLTVQEFQAAYLARIEALMGEPDFAGLKLRDIIERAALAFGIEPRDVFGSEKGDVVTKARMKAIEWALKQGHLQSDIASVMGCSRSCISSLAAELST